MQAPATRSGMIARLRLSSEEYDLEVARQPCLAICFVHSPPKDSSLVIKRMILRPRRLTGRLIPTTFYWGASDIDRQRLFVCRKWVFKRVLQASLEQCCMFLNISRPLQNSSHMSPSIKNFLSELNATCLHGARRMCSLTSTMFSTKVTISSQDRVITSGLMIDKNALDSTC
jgi:hypothetical protein